MAVGPLHRDPWLLLHKATFIAWVVFTALHIAGHLPEISRLLGVRAEIFQLPGIRTDLDRLRYAEQHRGQDTPLTGAGEARVAGGTGSRGRLIVLGASLIVGAIVAVLLIPGYHTWTALQPLLHQQDH